MRVSIVLLAVTLAGVASVAAAGLGACRATPGQPTTGPLYKKGAPTKRTICEVRNKFGDIPIANYLSKETADRYCTGVTCFGLRTATNATRLILRGRVTDTACKPIAGAVVDAFQPSPRGVYSSVHPGEDEGDCRAVAITNANGEYEFETYEPGTYGLFSGAFSTDTVDIDFPPWVPKHFHMVVWAKGYMPLITQLYFTGDPVVDFDARAAMAGMSLGATDDGLRVTVAPCKPGDKSAAAGTKCVDAPLTLMKATAAPYSEFGSLYDAVFHAVCMQPFNPGQPLAFCYPAFEPYLRPIITGPILFLLFIGLVSIPVLAVVFALRCCGLCGKKKRAGDAAGAGAGAGAGARSPAAKKKAKKAN